MKLYAVFSRGPPKIEGRPRQLPHSPHPISTTDSMAFCQNTKILRHTLILFTVPSWETLVYTTVLFVNITLLAYTRNIFFI